MSKYFKDEWKVQDQGDAGRLGGKYWIVTKTEYVDVKQNGEPKKNAKYSNRWVAIACYRKEAAERVCVLHNTQIRQDSDPIRELIDMYLDGAKNKLLDIMAITENKETK